MQAPKKFNNKVFGALAALVLVLFLSWFFYQNFLGQQPLKSEIPPEKVEKETGEFLDEEEASDPDSLPEETPVVQTKPKKYLPSVAEKPDSFPTTGDYLDDDFADSTTGAEPYLEEEAEIYYTPGKLAEFFPPQVDKLAGINLAKEQYQASLLGDDIVQRNWLLIENTFFAEPFLSQFLAEKFAAQNGWQEFNVLWENLDLEILAASYSDGNDFLVVGRSNPGKLKKFFYKLNDNSSFRFNSFEAMVNQQHLIATHTPDHLEAIDSSIVLQALDAAAVAIVNNSSNPANLYYQLFDEDLSFNLNWQLPADLSLADDLSLKMYFSNNGEFENSSDQGQIVLEEVIAPTLTEKQITYHELYQLKENLQRKAGNVFYLKLKAESVLSNLVAESDLLKFKLQPEFKFIFTAGEEPLEQNILLDATTLKLLSTIPTTDKVLDYVPDDPASSLIVNFSVPDYIGEEPVNAMIEVCSDAEMFSCEFAKPGLDDLYSQVKPGAPYQISMTRGALQILVEDILQLQDGESVYVRLAVNHYLSGEIIYSEALQFEINKDVVEDTQSYLMIDEQVGKIAQEPLKIEISCTADKTFCLAHYEQYLLMGNSAAIRAAIGLAAANSWQTEENLLQNSDYNLYFNAQESLLFKMIFPLLQPTEAGVGHTGILDLLLVENGLLNLKLTGYQELIEATAVETPTEVIDETIEEILEEVVSAEVVTESVLSKEQILNLFKLNWQEGGFSGRFLDYLADFQYIKVKEGSEENNILDADLSNQLLDAYLELAEFLKPEGAN